MPTIETKITKVERDPRNAEWVRIYTDHPTVEQLSTKDNRRAQEAFGLASSGERVVLEYTSRPRTLEDGRTFQNYYYDSAITATHNGGAQAEIPMGAAPAGSTAAPDPEKEWKITLAVGAKLAVATLPLMTREQDKTFEAQTALALAWAVFLISTPKPDQDDFEFGGIPSGHDPVGGTEEFGF